MLLCYRTVQYLSPPAKFYLEHASQSEGYGPGHCGAPREEPQSLGQLHPFLKWELHLHHHHDCRNEGVRVVPGRRGRRATKQQETRPNPLSENREKQMRIATQL